ncbi:hypothetical protein JYU21_02420 [Alkaliphilus sp. AH-315-G20]|nr:hypothetical protein [Alkaliphilus sp. AH-315-G20]
MKFMKLLLSIFISCSLLVGCISKIEEKTVYSDALIFAKTEEINLVEISNKQDKTG